MPVLKDDQQTPTRPLTLGELVALLGLLATTFAVGITVGYLLAM